jgi:signal transduction histidine kinase
VQSLAVSVAAFAFVVGLLTYFANPSRFANQVFALISLMLFLEAGMIFAALSASSLSRWGITVGSLPWVRANAAVIGFFPWALWLLKESVVVHDRQRLVILIRSMPWFLFGLVLAFVCYSEAFIPSGSRPESPERGVAYIIRTILLLFAFTNLAFSTVRRLPALGGINYVGTKFLVIGGVVTASTSLLLVGIGTWQKSNEIKSLAIVVTLLGYTVMAWAMTIHRVFDARQVLASCFQRIITICIIAFIILALFRVLDDFFGKVPAIALCVTVGAVGYVNMDKILRKWIGIDQRRSLSAMRNEAIALTSLISGERNLEAAFARFFASHCEARTTVMFDNSLRLRRAVSAKFDMSEEALATLLDDGWVTPESLERRSASSAVGELIHCMSACSIGLLIMLPAGSRQPSLFIAFGRKVNGWPYTFPEIEKYLNIAEMIDSIVAHNRVIELTEMRARLERWSFVSRGLAHDLKNLLVPVGSYLKYLESRVPREGSEREAYWAAIRAMEAVEEYTQEGMIYEAPGEINKIVVPINLILNKVANVTSCNARIRGVEVETKCEQGICAMVDVVLLERLITNLVVNAIGVSASGDAVKVIARRGELSQLQVLVVDNGPGVSDLDRDRIFDVFFTTQPSESGVRNFGLGLPIAKRIAELHGARLSVNSEPGKGATFIVEFPGEVVSQSH